MDLMDFCEISDLRNYELKPFVILVECNFCEMLSPFLKQTTNGPPRIAFPKKTTFIQRQPSPVLVRHVFAQQNQQQQQQVCV